MPKKVYVVTLHSRGGKQIYVESITRKHAVESADRLAWHGVKDEEWYRKHPFLGKICKPPKLKYPGPQLGDY